MSFLTTTESGTQIQGPTATLIYDDWYSALRADKLRKGKMSTAMLLDIPLVLGRRADGRVFAMRDSCPHRGIPLSAGWFDGVRVTCRYHGWEFEPCSGQCAVIPSLTSHDQLDATRIFATAYPCEERDGHAWVYIPSPGTGKRARGVRTPSPGAGQIRPTLSVRISNRRSALQCGSRHHRPDGPGPWTICASGVVVAFPRQHPRKDQDVSSRSLRVSA